MTRYRKALHYLPAILWLGIIFFLSGQTGEQTASLSLSIARWLARFFPGASEAGLHMCHRLPRHAANTTILRRRLKYAALDCPSSNPALFLIHNVSPCRSVVVR